MLFDSITIAEGGDISNLTINSGTAYPSNPSTGELFYRTDLSAVYVYTGSAWTTMGGSGSGSVTSVAVSGGTTGLTTSGGPITSSGTITLAGTLAIANGGTGQTTATNSFNALAPSQTGNSGKYLTTDGTNASWATVVGGALPTQTGNSGKLLTTDGTNASWANSFSSTFSFTGTTPFIFGTSAGTTHTLRGFDTTTGDGGNLIIRGGNSTNGYGGDLTLQTGGAGAPGSLGGTLTIQTGSGASDYGTINIKGGALYFFSAGTTESLRILSNGAWGLSGANYGTAGQVLTSNGSAAAPTWGSPTAAAAGSTNQIQYNSGGVLAASTNFTYNGTAVSVVSADAQAAVTIQNTSSTAARFPSVNVQNYSGSGTGGFAAINLNTSRGSSSAVSATSNNDIIYSIKGWGNTATSGTASWSAATAIQAEADNTFSTAAAGRIGFYTQATSAGGLLERVRVNSQGTTFFGKTSTSNTAVGVWIAGAGQSADYGSINIARPATNTMISFVSTTSGNAVGSITQNGTNTTYSTSSDYRLKQNVQPMTGALARVAQLNPCTYTWIATGEQGEGFIAHELQAVVPSCVTGVKDAVNEDGSIKPQGIDTSYLVATLTAAIQELKAELDSAKARIAVLEAK